MPTQPQTGRRRTEQIQSILGALEHVWMIHRDLPFTSALTEAGLNLDSAFDITDDDLEQLLRDHLRNVMKMAKDVT